MGLRIKKNDTGVILAGKNKGKTGRILKVQEEKQLVTIEGVNLAKKHMKPSRKYTQGGIIEKESPIHISNVMIMCPKCSKPSRTGNLIVGDGKKHRVCKKCKEVID